MNSINYHTIISIIGAILINLVWLAITIHNDYYEKRRNQSSKNKHG